MSPEASIEVFQPFALELHVPYYIKRGETLNLKVSVHNYLAANLPVNVSIESSDAFELVSPSSTTNCIEPRDSQVVEFRIRLTTLGLLNITIHGQVNDNSAQSCGTGEVTYGKDKLVKSIRVEAEGLPIESTYSRIVCPQEFDEDKSISWEWQSPYEHISGASVAIVGDIMGSVLDGLDTFLQIPVGCGEINMLTFTSLVYVGEYLESSKQLDEKLRKKIVLYLQKGYQVELNCRHKDGSFSTFGPRDEDGSVWYTALVTKSFAKARKFIFVDNQVMDESIRWIVNHQVDDGCFNASGAMLDKDFQQGVPSQGEEEHRMQRTAFALVSLIESGWKIDDGIIANAAMCIKRQQRTSLYTQALIAYALALSKDKDAREHFEKILTEGSTDEWFMWWELPDVPSEFNISSSLDVHSEFDNSSTYTAEYRNPFSVEITSYALLALLQFQTESDMRTVRHIVRWLSTQRSSLWFFNNIEDTPIGIQALAAYATVLGVTDVDLNVKIVAVNVNDTIEVQNEDRFVEKQVKLPIIPTEVQMEVEGSGCAVIRTTLLGSLQLTFQNMGFVLNITSEPIGKDTACVARLLKVCAMYLLGGSSSMTVMEINMVSGYTVEKQEMQTLLKENPNIKRAENRQDIVGLYYDSLDETGICASFVVSPVFEVQDAMPAYVRIADYYKPSRSAVETYLLPPACGLRASPFGGIDG